MTSYKYYLIAVLLGVVVAVFLLGSLKKEATRAVIVTNLGNIEIELNPKTPNAVEHFVMRARSGYYAGTRFHRVVPGLLIEGGDPLTSDLENKIKWGKGGSGKLFDDEIFAEDKMVRGVVAMSNHGKNTNDTQFFIVAAEEVPWLSGLHTIFGRVISGIELVENISRMEAGVTGIPNEEIKVIKIILR